MSGVQLLLPSLDRHTATGENGAFRLDALPGGDPPYPRPPDRIRPQRLEYFATGADTTVVAVVLAPGSVELAPIEVVVRAAPRRSPRMTIFEQRRNASTGGAFLTASLLRMREHSVLTDVLRGVSGVRVVNLNGGGRALASGRTPSASLKRGHGGTPCFMQIVVDGVRWSQKDLDTRGPYDIDRLHHITQLQAIEMYRGAAQTPVELNMTGSDCGTVVLWTR